MGYIDYRICLGHIYKFKKILFINQFQSVIFCITLIDSIRLDLCEHNKTCSAISVLQQLRDIAIKNIFTPNKTKGYRVIAAYSEHVNYYKRYELI